MNRLKGKKALVIGSGTGIGRAVCRLFAREGADLVCADLDRERELESLTGELSALGRRAVPFALDVTKEAEIQAAIHEAIEHLGHIDVLVNNAGVGGAKKAFEEESEREWERIMNVNLRGVAYGMKHVIAHMKTRRSGRIINTASQLAHKPSPYNATYCASKAAVVALTVSVAQEVATEGITVNAVCPGPTDTPMWRESADSEWNRWKVESLPMKRIGQPDEIAWAYVYLASDEASYCTGQSLSPNGGDVMW
ncbi:MAG: SDR family NAD(P)-dependent oxidoreductase [Gammaproteobacteria bacterium]